ncbi:MAG: hypothetical protein LBT94_02815 [Prevotellaceae bacterium]|jgi:hypothetical protein|nr:hypothetical protein [Prevotellaceae bacterium]
MDTKNKQESGLSIIDAAKQKFELACKDAASLQIISNFGAAFIAVNVVTLLREALTDEVMSKVFMPLMNTKVGFLTDRNGRPNSRGEVKPLYSISVVRDAIIDGVTIGLLPTGNQLNIIAERMYPTKEGYTALLRRLNVKYFIDVSFDKSQNPSFAEIPCKISYEHNGEKNSFSIVATVKKDSYSSHDQLRGKAERRAKKALYEYITGCDFGDADENSSHVVDAEFTDVSEKVEREVKTNANASGTLDFNAATPSQQPKAAPAAAKANAKVEEPPF